MSAWLTRTTCGSRLTLSINFPLWLLSRQRIHVSD